jgi:hypothetical protein
MIAGDQVTPNGLHDPATVIGVRWRQWPNRPSSFTKVVTVRFSDGSVAEYDEDQLSKIRY